MKRSKQGRATNPEPQAQCAHRALGENDSMTPLTPDHLKRIDAEQKETAELAAAEIAANGAIKKSAKTSLDTIEILEDPPASIHRPLCLVDGIGYAASWIWTRTTSHQSVDKTGKIERYDEPRKRDEQQLIVIRDDGAVFTDANLLDTQSLSKLGLGIKLGEPPAASRIWSGAGVKRYLAGDRPNPADVFARVASVVDHFMDFSRSLAEQKPMTELVACYVLATYLLDAFPVIGYLWPNGDRGAGKTHLLFTVTELAYLGCVILAGGSYASLRDLADCGATLAFDDSENIMDLKRADPDKRALLLAGNRRGATVTFKEPTGNRGWVTRHVNTFCPRLFSAIKLPDAILASRSITIPLVRSADRQRTTADPLDYDTWPCARQPLIDDLWAVALSNIKILKLWDKQAARCARFSGRELEPWRAIFGVAAWLQEAHQVSGLFDRMGQLSVKYQTERDTLEYNETTRLCISALWKIFETEGDAKLTLEFETSWLAQTMNDIAVENEIADANEDFTNPRKVGQLLRRLRFNKADRTATRKRWAISRVELTTLATSYGMTIPPSTNGMNGKNGTNGTGRPEKAPAALGDKDQLSKCQTCGGSVFWQLRDGDDPEWRCRKCVYTGQKRIRLWDTETGEQVNLGGDE